MSIVIDANVAIAWFRPSTSKLANAALEELSKQGAVVVIDAAAKYKFIPKDFSANDLICDCAIRQK